MPRMKQSYEFGLELPGGTARFKLYFVVEADPKQTPSLPVTAIAAAIDESIGDLLQTVQNAAMSKGKGSVDA